MNSFDDLLNHTPTTEQTGQLSKEEYAAKKQTEREAVFTLSDHTAQAVAVDGAVFQRYLDVQSRFMRYSSVNTLLILAQKPDATRLGDFGHWKGQGAFVKSGQTGISILEPQTYTKEDGSPGVGYNVKKVFDISQVDARKIRTQSPPGYTERQLLGALIAKAPVPVSGADTLPDNLGALYDAQTECVFVRRGMGFADTFRSLSQELVFADLTGSPDSQADPRFSAYCASYMLCQKYGVDTQGFDFAAVPGVFEGMDAQEIKGELSQIRDAADSISGRLSRQLSPLEKAAKNQDAR